MNLTILSKLKRTLYYYPILLFLKFRNKLKGDFKRKLYIHIGMPKTGTSAIQAFLGLNQEYLHTKGFCYPGFKGFAQSFQTSAGNVPLMSQWIKHDNKVALMSLLESSLTSRVILSSEILFNVFKSNPRLFREYFQGIDIKVICYVRNMDELVESCLNQQVKNHGLVNTESIDNVVNNHDYMSGLLEALKYIPKNELIIRKYNRDEFVGGNIYSDFLDAVGINEDQSIFEACSINLPQNNVNPSLNQESLQFRKLINRLRFDVKRIELKYKLNALLAGYSVENPDGRKYRLLSIVQRQKLYERFVDQFKKFNDKFGLDCSFQTPDFVQKEVTNDDLNVEVIMDYIKKQDPEFFTEFKLNIENSDFHNLQTQVLLEHL